MDGTVSSLMADTGRWIFHPFYPFFSLFPAFHPLPLSFRCPFLPPPLDVGYCSLVQPPHSAVLIYFLYSSLLSLLPPLSSLQNFVPCLSPSPLLHLGQCFSWRRCDGEEQEAEEEQLGSAGAQEASTEEVMLTLASSLLSPLLLPFLPLFSQLLQLQKMKCEVRGERRRGGPSLTLSPGWGVGVGGACI